MSTTEINASNLDLAALASQAMTKQIEEKLIPLLEVQAEKTIEKIISDALGRYGFLTKQIETQFKENLKVDIGNLAEYNDLISHAISDEVGKYLGKQVGVELTEKAMKHIKKGSEYTEISLQEILNKLKEAIEEDYHRFDLAENHERGDEFELSLHIEKSEYGTRWISIDSNEGKSRYECQFRFAVGDDGHMFGYSTEQKYLRDHAGFERFMYALCMNKVKVTMASHDPDDYDLYVGYND